MLLRASGGRGESCRKTVEQSAFRSLAARVHIGIRAASFGLGALQALDRELGLLYGDRSADYLAAVSGGSYVAATSTLIARQLASGAEVASSAPPLSEGSPEANRIIGRGDYLRRWPGDRVKNWVALALVALLCVGGVAAGAPWWIGVALLLLALGAACARWLLTAVVFGFAGLLNVAGFVALVLLVASLVVVVDALWTRIPWADDLPLRWIARPEDVGWLAASATAFAALTGGRLALRSLYRFRWDHRGLVLGLALACVGAPGLAAVLGYDTVRVLVLALTGSVGMMLTSGETLETQLWKRGIRVAVPCAGLVALWAMVSSVRELVERGDRLWLIFVVPGAFLMSQVVGRISLHHLYRGRLAATFCVRRPVTGSCAITVPPREPLSDLACDTHDPRKRYPRLLICATVNVKTDAWPQTDWQTYQPFVFSPERCGLGMAPDGSFATKKLEAARRPAFLRHDPVVSVMTAVACAGAAVSPGMGNRSMEGLRSIIALVNLRLGAWLPNPHCHDAVAEVRTDSPDWWLPRRWYERPKHWALGGGFDEFVPELFGLQSKDAARAYVSDGGHYDNLGLLTLLQARCETIWCVDSQADRWGRAGQLQNTVALAERVGLITGISSADEDPYGCFAVEPGGFGARYAIYTLNYEGGGTATLIVIKLASAPGSSTQAFRAADRWFGGRFAYDSTFTRVAFGRKRVDAYRALGNENAAEAIEHVREQGMVAGDTPDTRKDPQARAAGAD